MKAGLRGIGVGAFRAKTGTLGADISFRLYGGSSQIVERWGGLSDELKRAVLRVVGSGRSR